MIIVPANTLAAGGFEVANSCRFNDGDTATLEKALGTPTSQKKFTYSCWFKRGVLSGDQSLFSCGSSGDDEWNDFRLGSGGEIQWYIDRDESYYLTTDRLFRDVSAFYNFIIVVDTTQATDTNRVKIYVNGTQIPTADLNVTGYPAENYDLTAMASGENVSIGKRQKGGSLNLDGYLAEACFIDGLALSPTSFGEFDEDSPSIWKPIDVSGLTFGNNGFYLDFEDSANLGNDANGGTDLTESNLAAADQATDTPTNNFCTMNPLEKNTNNTQAFSEGNNVVVITGGYAPVGSTMSVSSGKWYVECHIDSTVSSGDLNIMLGINGSYNDPGNNTLGYSASAYGYYLYNGYMLNNNSGNSNTGGSQYNSSPGGGVTDDNKTWSLALDCDNNKLYVALNGSWLASGDPAAGSNGFAITAPASTDWGAYRFANGVYFGHTNTFSWNFGGCPGFAITSGNTDGTYGNFEYAVPSGFKALCTKNLAEYG